MKHTEKLPESPDKIGTKFFAYSKSAPATAHEVDPYDSSTWTTIAADKPLAVIVHGWRNDGAHPTMLEVKDALLGHEVATVIAVDWKEGADDTLYTQSAVNTELVGRQVAFLINSLSTKKNLSPSKSTSDWVQSRGTGCRLCWQVLAAAVQMEVRKDNRYSWIFNDAGEEYIDLIFRPSPHLWDE